MKKKHYRALTARIMVAKHWMDYADRLSPDNSNDNHAVETRSEALMFAEQTLEEVLARLDKKNV